VVRIILDKNILNEIVIKARLEDRTVLGIIYSEYIGIHFPLVETLNPKNIYCTASFISKLLELDKELMGERAKEIYMQYSPSVFNFKTFGIEENEMIAGA
jgi:hypothetical protein